MKAEIQTYLAENNEGESIFKIEMMNIDCATWLNFKCEIEIAYDKHPELKKAIAELSSPDTTPEIEMNIIQDILSQVTTIEGIKKCKIVESSNAERLEVEKRFNQFLTFLALQTGVEEYVPFSAMNNQIYFTKFVKKISPYLQNLVEVDRNIFEEIITGHPELQEEYVQHYATDATFYMMSAKQEPLTYQFFIMKKGVINLFFFTRHLN